MKRLLIACLVITNALAMSAQTETLRDAEYVDGAWVLSGVTGINLSQTALSNWSAGGENSLAGNAYLNGTLLRKRGNWLWYNHLMLEYGLSRTDNNGVRKTNDNINFSTQIGYMATQKWFYTLMGDFKTQFNKGYKYPERANYISRFMSPAYSNVSLGMEYRPRPNLSVYLSPVSAKMTFVTDDSLSNAGAFGVDPGKKFKIEMGAYVKARIEQTIMENVKILSVLDLFTPYDSSFGNVDINWDVLISMKINEFLSATLNTTLKYDNEVKSINDDGTVGGPKVQFKEILGVGLTYNF